MDNGHGQNKAETVTDLDLAVTLAQKHLDSVGGEKNADWAISLGLEPDQIDRLVVSVMNGIINERGEQYGETMPMLVIVGDSLVAGIAVGLQLAEVRSTVTAQHKPAEADEGSEGQTDPRDS
jgi:hypothetical protein